MKKIAVVIGTRPTFTDMAPVIHQLQDKCDLLIYNSGQHYDREMSDVFFEQLKIPDATYTWNVGQENTTHAEQTGTMMIIIEKQLMKDKPDTVLIKGDTNTSLAAALAASKLRIPIAHVEAGCRASDSSLPEEVNRKMIGQVTSIHYAPDSDAVSNLEREGIQSNQVFSYGHPVIDAIEIVKDRIKYPTEIVSRNQPYYFMTIHRDFNVDDPDRLSLILQTMNELARTRKIVFAVHPRTQKRIEKYGLAKHTTFLVLLQAIDYITSLSLQKHAYAVVSDSGGIQKEASVFGIPMISLRPNTEWKFTLVNNVNQLAFSNGKSIDACIKFLENNYDEIKKNAEQMKGHFCNPVSELSPSDQIAESVSNA